MADEKELMKGTDEKGAHEKGWRKRGSWRGEYMDMVAERSGSLCPPFIPTLTRKLSHDAVMAVGGTVLSNHPADHRS